MKILDLLEKQIDTVTSTGNFHGQWKSNHPEDGEDSPDVRDPNLGFFSRVAADKKDPHMVVKNTIRPEHGDGYHQYVRALIEMDLIDSNIHFPRVYNIKKITDKNGNNVYKYNIEKLVRFMDLDEEMQESVLENNFDYDKKALDKWKATLSNPERAIGIEIAIMMGECISHGKNSKNIKQESLLEALVAIRKISQKYRFLSLDLHANNFMIRMTSTGPQIVLTDPFS